MIDPILCDFERRLTPLTRQISDICIDWLTSQFREIVRLGFGEETSDAPIWDQVKHDQWFTSKGRRLVRLATQIDELTLSTAKAIEQAFVDERRQEWLDAYIKTAYPKYTSIRIYRRRVADSLESIDRMSDDEQAFLSTSVEEYERRMRDLLDRYMAASNAYWTPRLPGTDEERSNHLRTEKRDRGGALAAEVAMVGGAPAGARRRSKIYGGFDCAIILENRASSGPGDGGRKRIHGRIVGRLSWLCAGG